MDLKKFNNKKFSSNRERTITQKMFASRLSKSMNISKKDAEHIVECVKEEIISCLKDGLCVKIIGLGTLGAYIIKGRTVTHNIFAGSKVIINDRLIVRFKASERLNALINASFSAYE